MNIPASTSDEPTPEQDPEAPPTASDILVGGTSNDGSGDATFEPPIPAPLPDELSVPPIPVADVISGLPELPEVDPTSPQPAPKPIFISAVPERPVPGILESLPDPPVPAIPPAPVRSIFEQGIAR